MSFSGAGRRDTGDERLESDEGAACVMSEDPDATYAEPVSWEAARPRFRPLRLLLALVVGAVAVIFSGLILPGVEVKTFLGALEAAVLIAVLNAVLPPLVAALRLPFMLIIGFLAVLIIDALILLLVSQWRRATSRWTRSGGRCWRRW